MVYRNKPIGGRIAAHNMKGNKMTIFESTTIILLPIALSMCYASKKHNEELLKKEREEQREHYQYVKENWMYLKGGNNE